MILADNLEESENEDIYWGENFESEDIYWAGDAVLVTF